MGDYLEKKICYWTGLNNVSLKNTFPLLSGTVSLSRRTPLSGVIYIPGTF